MVLIEGFVPVFCTFVSLVREIVQKLFLNTLSYKFSFEYHIICRVFIVITNSRGSVSKDTVSG